jgi:DNA-binding transcriptional regulator YdaS (Cro superfamily)
MDAIDLLNNHLAKRELTEPGQQTRLAAHLDVTPGMVWQWLNRKRPIAPTHARGIEQYTCGEVPRYMIAPKVFGIPSDGPESTAAPPQ